MGFGTHEAKTAADSITWEVIARKLADLHESSQLIDCYVNCKQKSEYIVGGWVPAMLSHSFVAIRRAITVDVRELGNPAHCSTSTKFCLII